MARFSAFCSVLACMAWMGTTWAADEGPSDKAPELKVLDQYAGSSDVEFTSKGQPYTKGKEVGKWILDGRFLQHTGEWQSEDGATVFKFSSLMTYDPVKKAYRSWFFLSNGNAGEMEGTWNAKERVMTWISRKDETGNFLTITGDSSEAGGGKWKHVLRDGKGKVVYEMSGKSIPQKK